MVQALQDFGKAVLYSWPLAVLMLCVLLGMYAGDWRKAGRALLQWFGALGGLALLGFALAALVTLAV
jgi:pheromone shutdown protein TraB